MLTSWFLGIPLGLNFGILLGDLLFKKVYKREARPYLKILDETADNDPTVEFPQGEDEHNVSFFKQRLLSDTSPALSSPDYERVRFMNKILKQLWPHLSPAIHKEVIAQTKEPIRVALEKIPLVKGIRVHTMDLGTRPFRLDSLKSYDSSDNLIMMEAPIFWGGDILIRLIVEVCLGGKMVDVPIQMSCIQFKALARITLYPLVEQLPCVGGLAFSLLEEPTVDMDLRILDSPDLLSVPPIPMVLKILKKVVIGKMLKYPNEITIPIMPNFGLPPTPKGIFRIRVLYGLNIKSSWIDEVDPFAKIEVRKGRGVMTKIISNNINPTWDETFDMVVDNFEKQMITVSVYDDDILAPSLVGAVRLDLKSAEFVRKPNEPYRMLVPIFSPKKSNVYEILGRRKMTAAHHSAFVEDKVKEEVAKKPQAKLLIPMLMRRRAAKKARKNALHVLQDAGHLDNAETSEEEDEIVSNEGTEPHEPSSPHSPKRHIFREKPVAPTGQVCIEVTFIPFANETVEDASQVSQKNILKRNLTFSTEKSKGVLYVHVIKATQLADSMNTFVEIAINDPLRETGSKMTVRTPTEHNEKNPKYDYETDFVNISEQSRLTLTVYEVGYMDNIIGSGVKFLLGKSEPKVIGFVDVLVKDIGEVGSLHDRYSLVGAQAGEIHITASWLSLELS
jgi:hypothetical protein